MISKLNFAALLAPLVQIDLQDGTFENDSGSLKTQWVDGIEKLISILNKEPSALRMTYYVGEEKMLLARKRMAILKRIIESRRKQTLRHEQLPVEIRIVQLK
jgi:large repetitive protein